jgi:DNA topoisomerase-3
MVVRRFLAAFHPEAEFENTRVETTVADHVFRTRGKGPARAGLARRLRRDRRGRRAPRARRATRTTRARAAPAQAREGESAEVREVESLAKETKPPRRYSDASLLGAMETAGKLVDDDELREAMKDSGIGTPATRAAIIERLITVGYLERDGRALVATEKGLNVIRLLAEHPLTSPSLTGEWEHRLALIEEGADTRPKFMGDIAKFAVETVADLDAKLKDVRIPRAKLGPCPVCGREISENRKGYSCWAREDPGCGFVIWKAKAGKQLPVAVAQGADQDRPHGQAGDRLQGPLRALVPRPPGASSRTRRASGASSSTSRGRARAPSRPSRRRRRPQRVPPRPTPTPEAA